MVPLHPVALGLVIIALVVDGRGWDLLPDPLGWLLVLVGTRALPATLRHRGALLTSAALALVVSAVVWPPAVAEQVSATDDSVAWALSLPQLAYLALLADAARYAARQAGAPGRAAWFAVAGLLAVAAAVLPVLVLGAGVDALAGIAVLAATLALVLLTVLALVTARAPWLGGHPRPVPGLPRDGAGDGRDEGSHDASGDGPGGPGGKPDRHSRPKSGESS